MRAIWAIAGGLALGIGIAWWLSRETPEHARAKRERAERAASDAARDARPVLYRWRDADGTLQVTQQPPRGRRYERVDVQPRDGIEVHGDRE